MKIRRKSHELSDASATVSTKEFCNQNSHFSKSSKFSKKKSARKALRDFSKFSSAAIFSRFTFAMSGDDDEQSRLWRFCYETFKKEELVFETKISEGDLVLERGVRG